MSSGDAAAVRGRSARAAVVIAAHDAAPFVREALHSVQSQEGVDWVCVVVDDGSTDATAEVVREVAQADQRVVLLQQQQAGPAAARNRALRSGLLDEVPYVWFLDADDALQPRALATLTAYLDERPEVEGVTCQFSVIDADSRHVRDATRARWVPGRVLPRRLKAHERETPFVTYFCATGMGAYALFRTSAVRAVGGYDEALWSHEDADLHCKLALRRPLHTVPDRLYAVRVHGPSLTTLGQARGGGERFRQKWDSYVGRDAREQEVLAAARRYHQRRHVPFRCLEVALRAARDLLRAPSRRRLRWVGALLADAARGFAGRPTRLQHG